MQANFSEGLVATLFEISWIKSRHNFLISGISLSARVNGAENANSSELNRGCFSMAFILQFMWWRLIKGESAGKNVFCGPRSKVLSFFSITRVSSEI